MHQSPVTFRPLSHPYPRPIRSAPRPLPMARPRADPSSLPRGCASTTSSLGLLCAPALDLHRLDVIALLPVEQVVRINPGTSRLLRDHHRDRLLAGSDAMPLHVH